MFPEKDVFIKAVRDFRKENETCGTVHWALGHDDRRTLALVIGWTYCGGYAVAAKIAVQPRNCIMQCDYEWDWDMPYREDDGEVWDNECVLVDGFDEGEAWLHFKNIYDRAGAQGIFDWMDGKEDDDAKA